MQDEILIDYDDLLSMLKEKNIIEFEDTEINEMLVNLIKLPVKQIPPILMLTKLKEVYLDIYKNEYA